MDRRMYRSNMGNRYNRNVSPYRANNPVCEDALRGYTPEEGCNRRSDCDRGPDCDRRSDCDKRLDCDEIDFDLRGLPLGMCYVPWQCFENLYENEFIALANGTLFKDLDLDWYGRGCK